MSLDLYMNEICGVGLGVLEGILNFVNILKR